jgi:hypothetical protein
MKTMTFFLIILSLTLAACQPAPPERPVTPQDFDVPPGDSDTGVEPLPQPDPLDEPVNSDEPVMPDLDEFLPRAGDEKLAAGRVYISSTELLIQESFPNQFVLAISGELPDPCHELRAQTTGPDEKGRIDVRLSSVRDSEMMCIQVLQPFDINIPLGSFPAGEYQVYLNDDKVADFNQD